LHHGDLTALQVSLMDEAGNTKDDLTLPKGTDDAEKLAQQIKEDFEAGKELVVTVLKVSLIFCYKWGVAGHAVVLCRVPGSAMRYMSLGEGLNNV
jgi:hypothetical protein